MRARGSPHERACELAKQETPDALIHYVNRTKGTYNLYVHDYVGQSDAQRWEEARQKTGPRAVGLAIGGR